MSEQDSADALRRLARAAAKDLLRERTRLLEENAALTEYLTRLRDDRNDLREDLHMFAARVTYQLEQRGIDPEALLQMDAATDTRIDKFIAGMGQAVYDAIGVGKQAVNAALADVDAQLRLLDVDPVHPDPGLIDRPVMTDTDPGAGYAPHGEPGTTDKSLGGSDTGGQGTVTTMHPTDDAARGPEDSGPDPDSSTGDAGDADPSSDSS